MLPSALGSWEEAAPAQDGHLEIRPVIVGDGLGHSGEPEEEEEVIVLEEPKSEEAGPKGAQGAEDTHSSGDRCS